MATRSVTKAAAKKAPAAKAPAKAKATTAKESKSKAAAKDVEEAVADLEIVEDSTETDEAPAVEEKPAKKGKAGKAKKETATEAKADEKPAKKGPTKPPIEFGSAWLVEYINKECGTEYKAFDLRVLLRKMAKSGELKRDVGEDRSRYEFEGPDDKVVKAVLKKVKAGDIDKAKKDSLAKLKESAAAKKGKKDKGTKGKSGKKGKPVDEESEGVEEID